METITKKTRAVGTSAGVLLPRSWLNKRVVVTLEEKNIENITKEIINFLVEKNLLNEVKGIYLIGSYARDEESSDSVLLYSRTRSFDSAHASLRTTRRE